MERRMKNDTAPVRLEQFKIVLAIGKHKWDYVLTKDGMIRMGATGVTTFDKDINARGQQALTVFIEEMRKAMREAKRRILAGEVPPVDNGMGMFEAAGLKL